MLSCHRSGTQFSNSYRLLIILALVTILVPQVHAATGTQILSSSPYMDTLGYYHVVGEVLNQGSQAVNYVQITATFYNQSNTVVGTAYTFTTLGTIPPGRLSPFDLFLYDVAQSVKVHHYTLNIQSSTTTALQQKLVFLSNSSYISHGYFYIVGEIKNTATQSANYAEVIATYYNSTGGVIASGYTFTNPTTVGPNSSAPFELTLDQTRTALVDHYSLTAGANEYAVVSEYSNLVGLAVTLIPLTIIIFLVHKKISVSKQSQILET